MGKNNRMQGISKPEGSIAWLLTGAGAALIVNRFISGTPFITGLMAVVSAAFLSVQAFGNENGWLFCLARSITARVVPVASAQLQGGRPGAAGYKSMAYSLVFRSKEKTLTDEDINKSMKKILNGLESMGIELRS